jgi:uncharacterized protein
MTRSRGWRDGRATLHAEGGGGDGREEVTVPLEIATSYRARTRGLLGRDGIDGAMLLTPASSVHTFRMRFTIDVVYLDRRSTVIAVRTMKPGRMGALRLRARHVLEMEAGAAARWGLHPGTAVRVEQSPPAS